MTEYKIYPSFNIMIGDKPVGVDVVIPHVPSVPGASDVLRTCMESFDDVDQIIVVENEGTGYGRNVNKGLTQTKSEFIIISNNDIELVSGKLSNLKTEDRAISVPIIVPQPRDNLPRAIFGFNRKLYEEILDKYGYFFDESFDYYFEDDDLHKRLQEMNVDLFLYTDVVVEHLNGGGLTCKHFGEQEGFEKSKKIYEEKWN